MYVLYVLHVLHVLYVLYVRMNNLTHHFCTNTYLYMMLSTSTWRFSSFNSYFLLLLLKMEIRVSSSKGGGQKWTFKIFAGVVSYLDKIVKWQPKSKGGNSSARGGEYPTPLPLNETLEMFKY